MTRPSQVSHNRGMLRLLQVQLGMVQIPARQASEVVPLALVVDTDAVPWHYRRIAND
jgi:hypothetical protein